MLIRTKEEPYEILTQENDIPMNIPVCARPKTAMTDTRVVQQQSASLAKSAAGSESDTKNQARTTDKETELTT